VLRTSDAHAHTEMAGQGANLAIPSGAQLLPCPRDRQRGGRLRRTYSATLAATSPLCASPALHRGTLPGARGRHTRSNSEAKQLARRAATFTMPMGDCTTVARSALHLWQLVNSRTSLILRRSTLPRGSRWHVNHRAGAGQLAQRAAPYTAPSSARRLLCTKDQLLGLRRCRPVRRHRSQPRGRGGAMTVQLRQKLHGNSAREGTVAARERAPGPC